MGLSAIVLGSAAGGGLPQWNCNCDNCARARAGDPDVLPRTQSSLAVSADGDHWFLLNASPDIREQLANTPALHPREKRHTPIAGVVLTNGDVDHVAGLLTLRERTAFDVYASSRVLDVLNNNVIFEVVNRELVSRSALPLNEPVSLTKPDGSPSGVTIEAFPVPGKVALYLA